MIKIPYDVLSYVWNKSDFTEDVKSTITEYIKSKGLDERFYDFDFNIKSIIEVILKPLQKWALEEFKTLFTDDIYFIGEQFLFDKPIEIEKDYKEFVLCYNNIVYLIEEKPKDQNIAKYIYVIV